MLSTLSRRAVAATARAATQSGRSSFPAAASFHAGAVRRADAAAAPADDARKPADVTLEGPLDRYGLTDWKVYVPAGLALSVPFLANEWIILSEETQLVAAFVAFGTTVYKYAGGAIGRSLDERQDAIIQEINRLEELELKLYKETIEAAVRVCCGFIHPPIAPPRRSSWTALNAHLFIIHSSHPPSHPPYPKPYRNWRRPSWRT